MGCHRWLQAKGVKQWEHLYPETRFRADLAQGCVLCVEEAGRVVATVTVYEQAPHYYPDWIRSDPLPCWYICRLAVSRDARGQSIGESVLGKLERRAAAAGVKALRLDAVRANPFWQRYYEAQGFKAVSEYELHGTSAVVMEKSGEDARVGGDAAC